MIFWELNFVPTIFMKEVILPVLTMCLIRFFVELNCVKSKILSSESLFPLFIVLVRLFAQRCLLYISSFLMELSNTGRASVVGRYP